MQLTVLRVINNFGLDFKQFVENEALLAAIINLVSCKTPIVQRDAIMTLKNLNFEASVAERAMLEKQLTGDFLMRTLREQVELRDQVLLIIK